MTPSTVSVPVENQDLYIQKRAFDVTNNLTAVRAMLEPLRGKSDLRNLLQSPVTVTLGITTIQIAADTEQVDASDLCSLLIKEWPIAPCNTPDEAYCGMVSV